MLSTALCTFTVTEHVPTAKVVLAKLMVPVPAFAVTVPPQVLVTLGVVATTRFAGRLSVKLESIVTVFPLVMLKVIVLGVFGVTVVGLKLLVMDGGCRTVIVAVTVAWSTVASADPFPPVPPALYVAVACALAFRASG